MQVVPVAMAAVVLLVAQTRAVMAVVMHTAAAGAEPVVAVVKVVMAEPALLVYAGLLLTRVVVQLHLTTWA